MPLNTRIPEASAATSAISPVSTLRGSAERAKVEPVSMAIAATTMVRNLVFTSVMTAPGDSDGDIGQYSRIYAARPETTTGYQASLARAGRCCIAIGDVRIGSTSAFSRTVKFCNGLE